MIENQFEYNRRKKCTPTSWNQNKSFIFTQIIFNAHLYNQGLPSLSTTIKYIITNVLAWNGPK